MKNDVLTAFFRFIKAFFAVLLAQVWPTVALAQTASSAQGGVFKGVPESDWALGWLETIFRGKALTQNVAENAIHLDALARALREALSIYSLGMLVVAGFLVLYHVASMIVETAHQGAIMGRRTNQLWAPIRFVFAIGLLVPIGGGLNAGQYVIVKLAESGSSLASNAWRTAAETLHGNLGGMLAPRGPDVARLTAAATEMVLCRSLYRLAYAALQSDVVLTRVGNIDELQKIPPGRLMPETWRYSNNLQADLPLCGEYRFLASHSTAEGIIGTDEETQKFPNELAGFARADAERLTMQARVFAEGAAPSFLNASTSSPLSVDIGGSLASLMQDQQKTLNAKLQGMTSSATSPVDQALTESTAAGWVAAGFFVGNVVRRQAMFGEMATHAVPSAQNPLFGHRAFSVAKLKEAIAEDPVLRYVPDSQLDKVGALYAQVAAAMKKSRAWLYGKQMPGGERILPDTLDVQDQLGSTSDSGAGSQMFTHVLNSAMAAYGVWSESVVGNADDSREAFTRDMTGSPLAGLAEMGRRYRGLGDYLMGATGPALSEPNVMGAAMVFAAIGFVFSAAGFLLLFALPFLPLFRFMVGVLVWLLAVLEAIAALPLVALAHLYPAGEGLSGPIARPAYWLWLGVFMRPVLTLFGFLIGLILLVFALTFLNGLFVPLTQALYAFPADIFVGVRAGLAFLYVVAALAMTNLAFKGIAWLPDRVLHWLGHADPTIIMAGAAAAAGQVSRTVAPLPSGSPETIMTSSGGMQTMSTAGGTYTTGRRRPESSVMAAAKAHGLKSALLPAYREPPVDPVVIGAKDEQSVVAQGGNAHSSSAAAATSGDKASATATASAQATAIAMERQIPLPDKPTPADIEKALEKLASAADKRNASLKKDDKKESPKLSGKKEDSREQSSAPPEDDKPA